MSVKTSGNRVKHGLFAHFLTQLAVGAGDQDGLDIQSVFKRGCLVLFVLVGQNGRPGEK
jgi:hypothetical protein